MAQTPPMDLDAARMRDDLDQPRRDHTFAYDANQLTPREQRAEKLRLREEAESRQRARDEGVAAGDRTQVRLSAWHGMTYPLTHSLRAVTDMP